jgi:hypothetical protein
MTSRRFTIAVAILAVSLAANVRAGDNFRLHGTPIYDWHHGCSPTAGIMALQYWNAWGFDLVPEGPGAWREASASQGHIADYSLFGGVQDDDGDTPYNDMSTLNPGGAHANNCLADFMKTSFSALGLTYGSTRTTNIPIGMARYAAWRGVDFSAHRFTTSLIDTIERELLLGRPVLLSTDTDGDGVTDHSVTAVAYNEDNGYPEVLVHDTWGGTTSIRIQSPSAGTEWGVGGAVAFWPTGTGDSIADASGRWAHGSTWSGRTPDERMMTAIRPGATVTVAGPASAYSLTNYGALGVNADLAAGRLLQNAGQTTTRAGRLQADRILQMYCGGNSPLPPPTSYFLQKGGTVETGALTIVATGPSGSDDADSVYRFEQGRLDVSGTIRVSSRGRFNWFGGTLHAGEIAVEGSIGIGLPTDLGAVADGSAFGGTLTKAGPNARLFVTNDATVTVDRDARLSMPLTVGREGMDGRGFISMSEPVTLEVDDLAIENGEFLLEEGRLDTDFLRIRGDGLATFTIGGGGAELRIAHELEIADRGILLASPGTDIYMSGARFDNRSITPENLAGLTHCEMIFRGDAEGTLEVGGCDLGFDCAEPDYLLDALSVGDGALGGYLRLTDSFDNQPGWEGDEALYLNRLVLHPDSTLDLNGLSVYYDQWIDLGGEVVTGGGQLVQRIPEPTTALLLAAAGLLVRRRRA